MKKIIGIICVVFVFALSLFCINSYSASEVTFAHLSDIHIWSVFDGDGVTPTYAEDLLHDAIKQINEDKKNDFTIITGDVVNEPGNEIFYHVIKIFNELKKPWYYAIGNHDCSYPYEWPKENLIELVKRVNPNFIENGRYYSFSPQKGFTFIALDGGSYHIDDEQKAFLDDTIKKNPDDTVIIFLHTPIMPPIDLSTHILWQKDEMLEYFKQFNQPIAVFAGHFHATKIIKDGNVLHVATPSLRYSQEFRIVNVKNTKDKAVFTFDYKHTGLKGDFPDASRYKGEETDKNIVITLDRHVKK